MSKPEPLRVPFHAETGEQYRLAMFVLRNRAYRETQKQGFSRLKPRRFTDCKDRKGLPTFRILWVEPVRRTFPLE